MQSPLHTNSLRQLHVAIIMDGSGRWATSRGLPREEGHRAGVEAVRRVVAAADRNGIGTLTLFAFSGDNWHRPSPEVASLMHIFEDYFRSDLSYWLTSGARVSAVGRRDRLGIKLLVQPVDDRRREVPPVRRRRCRWHAMVRGHREEMVIADFGLEGAQHARQVSVHFAEREAELIRIGTVLVAHEIRALVVQQ